MILGNIESINNSYKTVTTRICDECKKIDHNILMVSIIKGRKKRKNNIDLCKKCSNSSKYKTCSSWNKGKDSPSWRGGIYTYKGRKRIYVSPGKMKDESIILMENILNRKLVKGETVHHIDFDKSNNFENNLFLFKTGSAHSICHRLMELFGSKLVGKYLWFNDNIKKYTLNMLEEKLFFDKKYNMSFLKYINYWKIKRKNVSYIYSRCVYYDPKTKSKKHLHNLIVEKIYRKLIKGEIIHHIDMDATNNDPKNLCILNNSEHFKAHRSLQNCIAELYKQKIVKFEKGTYSLWQNI